MPDPSISSSEKQIYTQIARELSSGQRDEALWTQAFAEQNGDESATKAMYIRLRVEELRRGSGDKSDESTETLTIPGAAPGPWDRWLARHLDLLIAGNVTLISLVAVLGHLHNSSQTLGSPLTGIVAIGILICMPAAVDALFVKVFGNSLGKKLWGIRVSQVNGAPLSFREVFRRNLAVFIKGLWMGLFPLSLIPQHIARKQLERTGRTAWDAQGDFLVSNCAPSKTSKWIGGTLLIMALIVSSVIAGVVDETFGLAKRSDEKQAVNHIANQDPKHGPWEEFSKAQQVAPAESQKTGEELFRLAVASLQGDGVPQDLPKGWSLMNESAAQGFPDGQFRAGLHAFAAGERVRGMALIEKAAAHGIKTAIYQACVLNLTELNNPDRAAHWCATGAASGDPESQNALGVMFALGKGVPKHLAIAYAWVSLSASQGNSNGVTNFNDYNSTFSPADTELGHKLAASWTLGSLICLFERAPNQNGTSSELVLVGPVPSMSDRCNLM